jgi:carboxylesterase
MPVDGAAFRFEEGEDRTVLLVHGFLQTPGSLRPFGKEIAERTEWAVEGFCLPGHGTSPDELRTVSWQDWTCAVEARVRDLQEEYEEVAVCGHSIGGVIAHITAHSCDVGSAVLLAPSFDLRERWKGVPVSLLERLVSPFSAVPWTNRLGIQDTDNLEPSHSYDRFPPSALRQVRGLQQYAREEFSAPDEDMPYLILHAAKDSIVDQEAVRRMVEQGGDHLEMRRYDRSGHLLHLDRERDRVMRDTVAFLSRQ